MYTYDLQDAKLFLSKEKQVAKKVLTVQELSFFIIALRAFEAAVLASVRVRPSRSQVAFKHSPDPQVAFKHSPDPQVALKHSPEQ